MTTAETIVAAPSISLDIDDEPYYMAPCEEWFPLSEYDEHVDTCDDCRDSVIGQIVADALWDQSHPVH